MTSTRRKTICLMTLGLAALVTQLTACQESQAKTTHPVPAAAQSAPKRQVGPRALCAAESPGASSADLHLLAGRKAAERTPELPDVWLALGTTWLQKARESADPGFYLNVRACADAALLLSPESSLAENLHGFSLLNDHRFRDARDLAGKILARDDGNVAAWGTLSDAELELGNLDAAQVAAQRMLDLRPGLLSYARASYLRWLRGDAKNAKLLGARAIRAGRESKDKEPLAWAIVQTATLFWNEGDHAGALSGYELALEEVPDYAPALVGKGRIALARGAHRDAVTHFEKAYGRSPLVETAWLLGDARRLAGDAAGAGKAYARVAADGKSHDRRTLSLFLSARKESPEEALALARAEFVERPGPYTRDALAWALFRSGKVEEAAQISKDLAAIPEPRFKFHAGAIRLSAGDPSGRKLVREALDANPAFDTVEAEEARQLVRS
jgi:tetratricopeptide (TPR) repeat protein